MSLKLRKPEDESVFEKQGDVLYDGLQTLVQDRKIYDHQAEAVKEIKKTGSKAGNVDYSNVLLVVLPTGTGKTGVGVLAAYACKAKRVLVVTPSEAISKQQLTQFRPVEDNVLNPLQSKPFLCERQIFQFSGPSDYDHWVPRSKCVLKGGSELESVMGERCELIVTNAHKFGDGSGRGADINKFPRNYFSLVIVDEAHHFPAKTWKNIVDHFREGEIILFLTATPFNKGRYILPNKEPCFELSHKAAVEKGIIRETDFIEITNNDEFERKECREYENEECIIMSVLQEVKNRLSAHDREDREYTHKAIVLATDKLYAAQICDLWNEHYSLDPKTKPCVTFIQNDSKKNVDDFRTDDKIKVLVVIYRLTEGFDYKHISVAAILRNVNKQSRVYFSQFVGRAVRKLHANDPVKATVISHAVYNQCKNYEAFKNCDLAEDIDEDPTLINAKDIEQETE